MTSPLQFARRLAIASVLAASLTAQAQTWPERPVRMIVPFPAGGATDLIARVIAQKVSGDIGQQIIVDNKPGAGGTIGTGEAAKGPPDGYTLLLTTSSTHAISPHLMPKLPYDPVRDFTPIAHLADAANVLLVTLSLPVKTVPELIDYAKAHPKELNYATSGNGTIVHLTTEAFNAQAGISMTHVPYKGTALSIPDLVSGQVQVLFDSIPTGMPHVKSGKLRALALAGPKRSSLLPDVPTLEEAGVKGVEITQWYALFAPGKTPRPVVDQLNKALNTALADKDVVRRIEEQGAVVDTSTPEQLAQTVRQEIAKWKGVVRKAQLTPD